MKKSTRLYKSKPERATRGMNRRAALALRQPAATRGNRRLDARSSGCHPEPALQGEGLSYFVLPKCAAGSRRAGTGRPRAALSPYNEKGRLAQSHDSGLCVSLRRHMKKSTRLYKSKPERATRGMNRRAALALRQPAFFSPNGPSHVCPMPTRGGAREGAHLLRSPRPDATFCP